MKISISLPSEDIAFLDRFAEESGYPSRSAVVRHAVRLLRASQLGEDYALAWDEWAAAGEADTWEATVADGVAGS